MDRPALEIDPDITRAHTPPGWLYTSEAVYRRCLERVLARSWQFIAHLGDLRCPGEALPVTLLPGSLDEPLVLTRDAEDRLHCLSNVCTHRGNIVCRSPGRARWLRCAYHGRSFGLDGRLRAAPGFEGAESFPSPADDLPPVPFGTWGPFVFASLDPAGALEEVIGPMERRLGWLPLDRAVFDPSRSRDYLVRANWLAYCENYLEGFHIPFVHESLGRTLDPERYATELFEYASLQIGIGRAGEDCFDLPSSSPDHGRPVAAYYFFLFPNTMFNAYPWGLSVNIVRPQGVGLTRVSFLSYVLDASRLETGAGAGLDRVEREDEAVVEATQRGLASRLYRRGRYAPRHERGVHHFHRLLARFLSR